MTEKYEENQRNCKHARQDQRDACCAVSEDGRDRDAPQFTATFRNLGRATWKATVGWACSKSTILANINDRVDWRRAAHSLKVGLALALVSLSVLLQNVFDKLGPNALWAILTVVVVFEYSVGATLSKGLNRGLGTIMAASLGLLVDYFANFTSASVEPYVVGFSVFLIGMTATYTRSVPSIKAKYDYGVVIFLLTFCLVVISGYRVSDNIDVVFDRIVTVIVGIIICLVISIFIFPIWAGDDLQKVFTENCEGLADSLEECLKEYFKGEKRMREISSKICKGQVYEDKIYKGYRGVLGSKQTEESLGNFASWEPRRRHFACMYPWKTLVELGAMLRFCAYAVSALHGCVLSEIQAPEAWRKVFEGVCKNVGEEVANVLRTLATSMRVRRCCPPKHTFLLQLRLAVAQLHSIARTHPQFLVPSTSFQIPNSRAEFRQQPTNTTAPPSPPPCTPTVISSAPPTPHSLDNNFRSIVSFSSGRNAQPMEPITVPPSPRTPILDSSAPCAPISLSDHRNASSNLEPSYGYTRDLSFSAPLPRTSKHSPAPLSSISRQNDFPLIEASAYSPVQPFTSGNSPIPSEVDVTTKEASKKVKGVMAPECVEFAEVLSLGSVVALLLEIVARVEHLVDANADFQEHAGFRASTKHEEEDCACHASVEIKANNERTSRTFERILSRPSSSNVE
ncbi:hypothetical protein KP509_33G034800 [Ceratopteris richardii]|uniref:Aluminum-activated malate transporter n=1 Tax=Ceratopteris richardii TaxID=49495 RepID=A0A8T2QNJ6_CERRI|nr:hypothetical protein KP509_33G034800 [Ceratopteris richardii]